METNGTDEAWIPMTDDRFDFYLKTVNEGIESQDFQGVSQETTDELLIPLRTLQAELKQIFAEASLVDTEELLIEEDAPSKPSSTPTKTFMN
jgi:hypothetical protein